MRKLMLLAFLASATGAAAATDGDTVCATLYTYLAESARLAGMSSEFFDSGAIKAESFHLSRNPTEDRNRYSLTVIDGAQSIRDGLAQGSITTNTVMVTATRCNGRYFPDSAAAQLSFPDDSRFSSSR